MDKQRLKRTIIRDLKSLFISLLSLIMVGAFLSTGYGADAAKGPIDGKKLYDELCARCHLDVEDSIRGSRSAARIRSALTYRHIHDSIRKLSDAEVEAIAKALEDTAY